MATFKMFLVDAFPQLILSIFVYGLNFQLRDFTHLKANPLQFWEIVSIYAVVFFFIFKNVLPKFVTFGGARRHYNDVKNVEKQGMKKFMTKNYIRLFMHILSGATQVLTSGAYVISPSYFNTIFSFCFLQRWFLFWDTIHQTTGFLMTRNHDGIFAIRAFNLAFMVVKLFFCGQIYQMTSMNDEFITLVGGIFILTSGFAWVRFTCSIIAITQCVFYKIDMTVLRENWYSWGLWSGQFLIAWRCQVLGHMHLVFAFAAIYFPIELWIKKNAHHKLRNACVTWFIAAFYFVEQYNHEIQIALSLAFFVYSYWFAGTYWKRAPIPGVDFNEKEVDQKTKKKFNLRRSLSLHNYAFGFISKLVGGKPEQQRPVPSLSSSVSRAFQVSKKKRALNAEQGRLIAEVIQANSCLGPEALAAAIVHHLNLNKDADTPALRHPMADSCDGSDATSPDSATFFSNPGRSGSVAVTPAEFTPLALTPGSFVVSRSPSQRLHFHY